LGGSGISWTVCKSFAPHCRKISTPAPHHSIFTGWMLFPTLNRQCEALKAMCFAWKTAIEVGLCDFVVSG